MISSEFTCIVFKYNVSYAITAKPLRQFIKEGHKLFDIAITEIHAGGAVGQS